MRKFIFSIMMLIVASVATAQSARDLIRMGNKAYRAGQYGDAETLYLKSLDKSPSFEAYYNLGLTYLRQAKRSEAFSSLSKAGELGLYDAYSVIKRNAATDNKK